MAKSKMRRLEIKYWIRDARLLNALTDANINTIDVLEEKIKDVPYLRNVGDNGVRLAKKALRKWYGYKRWHKEYKTEQELLDGKVVKMTYTYKDGKGEFKKDDTLQQNIDMVNHPEHYTKGKIEHVEYVKDRGWLEGYCLGNATKYMHRSDHKGKKVEDLKKAKWYLDYYIQYLIDNEPSDTL